MKQNKEPRNKSICVQLNDLEQGCHYHTMVKILFLQHTMLGKLDIMYKGINLDTSYTIYKNQIKMDKIIFFCFYGHTHGIWKFTGQRLNQRCIYATAMATPSLSHIFNLCCSLWQPQILNRLSKARGQTCILRDNVGSLIC